MNPLGENQRKRNAAAMTLVELLVVVVIIVVLAGLLLPALSGGGPAKRVVCMSHLKQICLGFRMWADDNGGKFPTEISVTNHGTMEYLQSGIAYIHFLTITNYMRNPKVFVCPCDTSRRPATNSDEAFNNSNLSYFLNVNLGTNAAAVILSGDRNLTLDNVPLHRGSIQFTNGNALGWTTNIHRQNGGNVGFFDGHVQWMKNNSTNTLQASGVETYHLLLP